MNIVSYNKKTKELFDFCGQQMSQKNNSILSIIDKVSSSKFEKMARICSMEGKTCSFRVWCKGKVQEKASNEGN